LAWFPPSQRFSPSLAHFIPSDWIGFWFGFQLGLDGPSISFPFHWLVFHIICLFSGGAELGTNLNEFFLLLGHKYTIFFLTLLSYFCLAAKQAVRIVKCRNMEPGSREQRTHRTMMEMVIKNYL